MNDTEVPINDDIGALSALMDEAESAPANALAESEAAIRLRIRHELAARSDGLRRAIVYYERLAEDAARVRQQATARATRIREYVRAEMESANVRSIATATGSIRLQGAGGKQPLTVYDEAAVPDELCTWEGRIDYEAWRFIKPLIRQCGIQANVHLERHANRAMVRERLETICKACGAQRDTVCAACGGTGKESVYGARLEPRGVALVVK